MNDLRNILRSVVKRISEGTESIALQEIELVREALKERGLESNCHVGKMQAFLNEGEHTLEWYAGQLLDIVDRKSWFAMNSYINALDQFCPEDDDE